MTCVVRKIGHVAFSVLGVLEVISDKVYLVYALKALTKARLFVALVKDVKSDARHCFA